MDFGWPQYQNPIAFFESSIYVIIVNLNEMRKAKTRSRIDSVENSNHGNNSIQNFRRKKDTVQ